MSRLGTFPTSRQEMTKRVCLDCHALVDKPASRCADHTRERDQARGTRQARGYGTDHDKLRAQWQRKLDAGLAVWCWRCLTQGVHTRINPHHWHLGHDDNDRTSYRGPECVPCNTATAGRHA